MLLAVVLCALVAFTQGEVNQQIVDGSDATYGEHPYICSIIIESGGNWFHNCGCVIWNANYVVTAAHCLSAAASRYRVVVGMHRLSDHDQYQVVHSVNSYTNHPGYDENADGYPNDIAVMEMTSTISFNSHVAKANFASDGNFTGQSCRLVGWGRLSGGGPTPNTVQKVNMTQISNSECANLYAGVIGASVEPQHICFFTSGHSVCGGDSGGPVHCGDKMTGITSWTIESCSGAFPSVYARVSHFYSWLVSQAGAN